MRTNVEQSATAEHGVNQAPVSKVGEESAASVSLQRLANGAAAYERPQSLLRGAKASPERLHDEDTLHRRRTADVQIVGSTVQLPFA